MESQGRHTRESNCQGKPVLARLALIDTSLPSISLPRPRSHFDCVLSSKITACALHFHTCDTLVLYWIFNVRYGTAVHWDIQGPDHIRRVRLSRPRSQILSANLFQLCSQGGGDWMAHNDPATDLTNRLLHQRSSITLFSILDHCLDNTISLPSPY